MHSSDKQISIMKCFYVVFSAVAAFLIVGCAPTIQKNTLLQLPSEPIRNLTIDVTNMGPASDVNVMNRQESSFNQAVPDIFSRYGVAAIVNKMKGGITQYPPSQDGFILFIGLSRSFTNVSQGSDSAAIQRALGVGQGSEYTLELYQRINLRHIWSGSIFVRTNSLSIEADGRDIANKIASVMGEAKLFSTDIVSGSGYTTPRTQQGRTTLSDDVQRAFEQFKSSQVRPKAFAIGNNGLASETAIGQQENEDPPSERALKRCQVKYSNCRILSDGTRVF